jgi:hypothetical protein
MHPSETANETLRAHAEQYRRVNEGIHRRGDERDAFLCECVREGCADLVELSAEAYEAVRAHPGRFFLLPGHELAELDEVIERHPDHLVVQRRAEPPPSSGG